MFDLLMLRLKCASYEPWIEYTPMLSRCVIAGRVRLDDLRGDVKELLSVWSLFMSL